MKVVSLISELSCSTSTWRIPNTLWEMLFRPLAARHQEKRPSNRRWIALWQETIIFPDIGMQVLLYVNHFPWASNQI